MKTFHRRFGRSASPVGKACAFERSRSWSASCDVGRMTPDELKDRTKKFAIEIVNLARTLPPDPFTREIGLQLVRSATSVAANYRSSCRSRSTAEFMARMGVVRRKPMKRGSGWKSLSKTEWFREKVSRRTLMRPIN